MDLFPTFNKIEEFLGFHEFSHNTVNRHCAIFGLKEVLHLDVLMHCIPILENFCETIRDVIIFQQCVELCTVIIGLH